jgi:hypothetical protein
MKKTITTEIDGYHFGDRLLEGVMFDVTFENKEGEWKVTDVKVQKECESYFQDLNQKLWLERAKEYAESDMEELIGDEAEIKPKKKKKAKKIKALSFDGVIKNLNK